MPRLRFERISDELTMPTTVKEWRVIDSLPSEAAFSLKEMVEPTGYSAAVSASIATSSALSGIRPSTSSNSEIFSGREYTRTASSVPLIETSLR